MEENTKELLKCYESLISGVTKRIEGNGSLEENINEMEKEIISILNKL